MLLIGGVRVSPDSKTLTRFENKSNAYLLSNLFYNIVSPMVEMASFKHLNLSARAQWSTWSASIYQGEAASCGLFKSTNLKSWEVIINPVVQMHGHMSR